MRNSQQENKRIAAIETGMRGKHKMEQRENTINCNNIRKLSHAGQVFNEKS